MSKYQTKNPASWITRVMSTAKRLSNNILPCHHTDADICKCACHEPGSTVMDFMPCCYVCEYCGKNIRR